MIDIAFILIGIALLLFILALEQLPMRNILALSYALSITLLIIVLSGLLILFRSLP